VRTTLTLDPDVAAKIRLKVKLENKTLRQVVNEALRSGLESTAGQSAVPKPYKVRTWPGGMNPGIDHDRINLFLDDLDTKEFAEKFLK
jgi:hypothetical protein